MTARLGGRLFQQYMVDAFSSIEQTLLWWFRINQTTLRNELYTHICDSLRKGNSDSSKIGKGIFFQVAMLAPKGTCKKTFRMP